jgi:class 3 adenylate cyclase/tetratricopeptide (TPR) repeat protein
MLFADLVGFTSLAETRDHEDVRALLSRYFDVARTIVARYGGSVEKFIGDAVMAVWGTPVAAEGDAERAVRAGLDLVAAVHALGSETGVDGLSLRAGVVTGQVAATLGVTGEGMVAGDPVNTAARVQAAAAPGKVWVDDATRRLAAATIGFTDAGEHLLKGKSESIRLWEAIRVHSNVGGSQRVDGLEAPMIGRDAEDRTLRELFHASAERSTARLAVISGPAGVGKSRLGWEFEKYVDGLADTVWWHRGRCLSYGDGVAYWAFAGAMRQRFEIAEEDPIEVATTKLLTGLERLVPDVEQRGYVGVRLGRLLGLPHPDDSGADLTAEDLYAGWRLFMERLAASGPVVWLVEDAQYADEGLLDFVAQLVEWSRGSPIFVVLFTRDELLGRRAELGGGRNRSWLTLDPLDETSMRTLVTALVRDVPEAACRAIIEHAQGNPLFAVETVRSLIDRDVVVPVEGEYRMVGDVGTLDIPGGLHSLLAARLDALDPPLRALVCDAAVLGTSFPAEALAVVSGRTADRVHVDLSELVRRGIFEVSGDPLSPERGSYAFAQNLFRQVTYDTISRRDRRARHLAVAEHLQRSFADGGEEVMEVVAQHYLDALAAGGGHGGPEDDDIVAKALTSLVRAGERAEWSGARARAAQSYVRAAELADDPREAALLIERGQEAYGLAAREDDAVVLGDRAQRIYESLGDGRGAARALGNNARWLRVAGRLEDALRAAEEALRELRPAPDADTVAVLCTYATTLVAHGDTDAARRVADEALGLAQALGVGDRALGNTLNAAGLVESYAMRLTQSSLYWGRAAELAGRTGDHNTQAHSLNSLAYLQLAFDPAAAVETARAAIAVAVRHGVRSSYGAIVSTLAEGLLICGQWVEALAMLDESLATIEDDHVARDMLQMRSIIHAKRGELVQAQEDAAAPSVRDPENVQDATYIAWLDAELAVASGAPEAAVERLRGLFTDELDLFCVGTIFSWPIAVRGALDVGDVAQARELVDHLGQRPAGHLAAVLRGNLTLARARLSALDDAPDATERFDAAVLALREAGSPFHLAHALLDRAEQTGSADDRAEASGLADRLESVELRRRLELQRAAV